MEVSTTDVLPEDQELTLFPEDYGLLTDLYELTMIACYTGEGLDQRRASFELSVRSLPQGYGYLIAMGLAQVIDYLQKLSLTPNQIAKLQALEVFAQAPAGFWTLLADTRFSGDLWAVPEGTVVLANQPLLRVEAPLWQAQLIETYLLNVINYQTLIATKAARMRDAAGPQAKLLEFGTRRAFGPQASIWAVRAALAAGLDATSNVLAALKLNRVPSGTMAHSLVMGLTAIAGNEDQAFTAFHRYFPDATLLIDTYDTVAAARRLAAKVAAGQMQVRSVRLDSGDLVSLSKQVKALLPGVAIFASGDVDEWEITRLKAAGAPIDGYGIGTHLVTGEAVNGAYKLVEVDGIPVMKESSSKQTYPGRKQIFRKVMDNQLQADRLGLATEAAEAQEHPLLQLVIHQGERQQAPEPLRAIAQRTRTAVASLPIQARRLEDPVSPPVNISAELSALTKQVRHQSR